MAAGLPQSRIDTSKPHPARVYDYLLGGKDNYLVDQKVGEQLPEAAKVSCRLNRDFMRRACAWAAGTGIDQYLDIGTGIPTAPNLHQIVQEINPKARIVYADNDPIVLSHAAALLVSKPEGATDYIEADVREPEVILDRARGFLDFGRPVALSLIALLHFLPDDQDPYGVTRTLVDALPPGSLLLLSHGTADFLPAELSNTITGTYRAGGMSLCARTRAEVERFFDGLEMVAPGLVSGPEWYKDTDAPVYEPNGVYAGVGRVR
ncbi:SAM-dependent methyltransferase [Streptomyces sp. NPDC051320]|uniref:SAM-dependent methyltransferase n=1 Tax=Streptomyces sp. NPDC051320 TaxID=3154644 RepID=UPI00344082BB